MATNITWHEGAVSLTERQSLLGQKVFIYSHGIIHVTGIHPTFIGLHYLVHWFICIRQIDTCYCSWTNFVTFRYLCLSTWWWQYSLWLEQEPWLWPWRSHGKHSPYLRGKIKWYKRVFKIFIMGYFRLPSYLLMQQPLQSLLSSVLIVKTVSLLDNYTKLPAFLLLKSMLMLPWKLLSSVIPRACTRKPRLVRLRNSLVSQLPMKHLNNLRFMSRPTKYRLNKVFSKSLIILLARNWFLLTSSLSVLNL